MRAGQREIRETIDNRFDQMNSRFDDVNSRFDRVFLAMLGIGAAQIALLITLIFRS